MQISRITSQQMSWTVVEGRWFQLAVMESTVSYSANMTCKRISESNMRPSVWQLKIGPNWVINRSVIPNTAANLQQNGWKKKKSFTLRAFSFWQDVCLINNDKMESFSFLIQKHQNWKRVLMSIYHDCKYLGSTITGSSFSSNMPSAKHLSDIQWIYYYWFIPKEQKFECVMPEFCDYFISEV